MSVARLNIWTLSCVFFIATTHVSRAELPIGLAQDNIDSQFNYWPAKARRAYEWETSAQHKFRVYKPQVTSTASGGLLVLFSLDHNISGGRDDHAEAALAFDAYGVLSSVQVTIRLARAKNTYQATATIADVVGNGAAGSALAGAGQAGAAVALVAKGLAVIGNAVGEQVNQNGGSELLPYEVQFVSERIARAVHASGYGVKVLHEGKIVQFWSGNRCGGEEIGFLADEPRSVKLGWNGVPNDQIRSLRIYNNTRRGTSLLLFDDGNGSRSKDDWAEITVDEPSQFSTVGECVDTLQANRQSNGIRVAYHRQRGSGNLDGKVSHITVMPPE